MTATAPETLDLQRAARDHLWLHFTRMGGYRDGEVPIIVRGDGCYLEDAHGKRYLDALAGLFSVNIGYGFGEEIGEAAAAQMRELPFYTNWSYAHPRAIELASEVASLAPGDLNRLFFVSGGSEAVESAWKLARQYYSARGEMRTRVARIPGQRIDPVVDYEAAEAAAFAALASSPRRLRAFRRLLADAQHLVPIREEQTEELTIAWPVMRRAVLRIGEALAERGAIAEPDDVFFLTRAEVLAELGVVEAPGRGGRRDRGGRRGRC